MAPLEYGGVVERSVRAAEGHASVLHLEDTAGGETLESTGEHGGDVLEAVHESTAVDVIEWLAKRPLVFGVVDLELAVWRNARQIVRQESLKVCMREGYNSGCIGLRSVPVTCDKEYLSAGQRC